MIRNLVDDLGFLQKSNVKFITPRPIPESLLSRTHSEEYLQKVRHISQTGEGAIDIDTPGFKGIYDNARIASGGTITGIESILSGEVNHFFSPTGGFHHARYERGGGFCIFNDVAAAVFLLKEHGFERILIADFDVHHGNGTQTYFYDDPGVMQISFHEDPEWLYPHDGFIDDIGIGSGTGYNVNMHFPIDSGDSVYRYAFDELVPPLIEFYKPEFIIFLPGFDAHYKDPLAQLNLTTEMIRYVAEKIHKAAHDWASGRIGVLSGGGYNDESFSWGAASVMSVLSGHSYEPPRQVPPFEDDYEAWDLVKGNVARLKETVFSSLGI
jgi:acetoin utilization protein AcuC